jgi:hypothetical protein
MEHRWLLNDYRHLHHHRSKSSQGPVSLSVERVLLSFRIRLKRIKGDALLKLLEDDLGVSVPMALVEAYDTIGQALDATHAKVYEKAIDLYLDGIGKANSVSSDQFDKSWLCKAYRGMAEAQLGAGDLDGAGKSIQDAMKVKDDDEESLEVLISICNRKKDSAGEYEALSKLLAKPRENLPRDVANRRRTQGFRLQKLQREVGQ